MKHTVFNLLLAAAGFILAPAAGADGPPLKSILVAEGLENPVDLKAPPGDLNRVFILEQPGRVRVLKGGRTLAIPFLDIESKVLSGGERGLLSLAFHPHYESNGYFYLYYTAEPDGDLTLERYSVSGNPDLADDSSAFTIFTIAHPRSNHNGGTLAFGPQDGYLYISIGDGGGAGDPDGNGQDLGTLLGTVLRIDVDWSPYTVPPDNPFVDGDPSTREEIWAWGLRNPWRISFDRENGDLYLGDVGQADWEEINWAPASSAGGENYGWNCYEGTHAFSTATTCGPPGDYQAPVLEYGHDQGNSVTGGYVYRGSLNPRLRGHYFYADFGTAFIRSFRIEDGAATEGRDWTGELEPAAGTGRQINSITSFGEDGAGELYICDRGGEIFKIVPREGAVNRGDYGGDGTSDITVFRDSTGLWAIRGLSRVYFGAASDLPAAGDFDGNGTSGIAIFRPASGLWAVRGLTRFYFGSAWDQPVTGDFDGDGRLDCGIFRETAGLWAIRGVTRFYFGSLNDRALPGDYRGDGTDVSAVYRGRSGLWAVRGLTRFYFGKGTDLPLTGDFSGDGTADTGIFRPSTGLWAWRGRSRLYYGAITDMAVPGDYSGDGAAGTGIFRWETGLWAIRGVTRTYFGGSGDLPAAR